MQGRVLMSGSRFVPVTRDGRRWSSCETYAAALATLAYASVTDKSIAAIWANIVKGKLTPEFLEQRQRYLSGSILDWFYGLNLNGQTTRLGSGGDAHAGNDVPNQETEYELDGFRFRLHTYPDWDNYECDGDLYIDDWHVAHWGD